MGLKTKGNVAGDVFIREDLTRPYDSTTLTLDNSAGATTLVLLAGSPMIGNALLDSAAQTIDPTTATSFLLNEARVPAGDIELAAALNNGIGVVVNYQALPTHDQEATPLAYVKADMIASLENLNFVVREEPAEIEVQTD